MPIFVYTVIYATNNPSHEVIAVKVGNIKDGQKTLSILYPNAISIQPVTEITKTIGF